MSTLQTTHHKRDRIRARLGTGLLALSILIALGAALLILTPTAHHTTTPPTATIAHLAPPAAPTIQSPGLGNCLINPDNQALACFQAAHIPIATPAPPGYFRDPATHQLLRLRTAPNRAGQHPANHSRGRIIP